jgi:hypothetical protein
MMFKLWEQLIYQQQALPGHHAENIMMFAV